MKKFNLSEEINPCALCDNVLPIRDVKEFIKEIKIMIVERTEVLENMNWFCHRIDDIAGEKLK